MTELQRKTRPMANQKTSRRYDIVTSWRDSQYSTFVEVVSL